MLFCLGCDAGGTHRCPDDGGCEDSRWHRATVELILQLLEEKDRLLSCDAGGGEDEQLSLFRAGQHRYIERHLIQGDKMGFPPGAAQRMLLG